MYVCTWASIAYQFTVAVGGVCQGQNGSVPSGGAFFFFFFVGPFLWSFLKGAGTAVLVVRRPRLYFGVKALRGLSVSTPAYARRGGEAP